MSISVRDSRGRNSRRRRLPTVVRPLRPAYHGGNNSSQPPPCAGTFPVSPDGCTVVVFAANGFPSMPKGSRERGETAAACAARETREECGLVVDEARLLAENADADGGPVLEYAHRDLTLPVCAYFFTRLLDKPPVAPQTGDDDIVEARWVPLDDLPALPWLPNRRRALCQLAQRAALYGGGTPAERLARRDAVARRWNAA